MPDHSPEPWYVSRRSGTDEPVYLVLDGQNQSVFTRLLGAGKDGKGTFFGLTQEDADHNRGVRQLL